MHVQLAIGNVAVPMDIMRTHVLLRFPALQYLLTKKLWAKISDGSYIGYEHYKDILVY